MASERHDDASAPTRGQRADGRAARSVRHRLRHGDEQVKKQALEYQKAGAPDITILGQSIMAYGKASGPDHPDFTDLMCALLRETDFRWITYLTSLACDMTDRVCEEVIANPRITPLLHLP